MKKSVLFISLLVALAAVFGIAPGFTAPADKDLHSSYDRELLEVYYQRAENATTEAEWQTLVSQGIEVVVGRWENAALAAVGDPTVVAGEKALLVTELDSEKSGKLSAYLVDRFFKKLSAPEIESVLQAVEDANKEYLYAKDGDGKIKRDAAGDPILYTQTNADTGATLAADKDAWHALVERKIGEVSSDWAGAAVAALSDLTAGSPELLSLQGEIDLKLHDYQAGITAEFERIRAQEERIFLAKRENDQYSLKKKSDAEAAGETVDRLIASAKESGDAGIARVRDGLERLDIQTSVSGIDVDSSDWLKSFSREFNRGLDSWEGAEREFLRRRTEWEKEAGIRFEAGEREWALAYQRLKDARAAWESGIENEKEEGLRLWKEKEDKLSVSLREASEELERTTSRRSAGVGLQISALMDMYLQADTVCATAASSIDFWRKDVAGLIAKFNEDNAALSGAADIDPKRLTDALTNKDTAALTALAKELGDGYDALAKAYAGRQRTFEDTLCVLMNRYIAAHQADPSRTITEEVDLWTDRFSDYRSEGGYGWMELSNSKCAAYIAPTMNANFTIDGQSIQSIISAMKGYADPRPASSVPNPTTTVSLTYVLQGTRGDSYSNTVTAQCWTQAWQTAASGYMAGEAKYYADHKADADKFVNELTFWLGQKDAYTRSRTEAAQTLAATYGLVTGNTNASERDAARSDWSTLLLDDYQRELLIAQGESNYWKKQAAVARAVFDYAKDTSSNRPTEAQTQAQYETALAEFQGAENAYATAAADLAAWGDKVNGTRAEYETAKTAWDAARRAVEDKQALYQEKMGVLMNMGDEYYRSSIQGKYAELLAAFGLKTREGTPTEVETLADYYAALARYGEESNVSANARELTVLLSGNATAKVESLAALKGRAAESDLIVIYNAVTWSAEVDESKIGAADPRKSELESAAAAYNALLGKSDADPGAVRLAKITVDGIAQAIRVAADEAVKQRIEALSLLTAGNFGEWTAAAQTGLDAAGFKAQAATAGVDYLRDKATLLSGVLDKISRGVYTSEALSEKTDLTAEEKIAYACFLNFSGDQLAALAPSLAGVAGVLSEPHATPGALRDAITSLTATDAVASGFFRSGGNIFADLQGADYTDLFAPALAADRDRKLDRAGLVARYESLAPCLIDVNQTKAMAELGTYLSASGLGTVSSAGYDFADPEAVWQAVAGAGQAERADVLAALKRYEDGLANVSAGLPGWVRQSVSDYTAKLADYFTLRLVMAGKPADTSSLAAVVTWHREKKSSLDEEVERLQAEAKATGARIDDLRTLERTLGDASAKPIAKLVSLYTALKDGRPAVFTQPVTGDAARYALDASEARAELVDMAGAALAAKAYAVDAPNLSALLASSAQDLGLGSAATDDPALGLAILARATEALDQARSIDQSLADLDFTTNTLSAARYALWQRFAPEAVRSEIAGAALDRIRSEMGKSAPDYAALRATLGLSTLSCLAGIKGEGKVYSRALYLGLVDAGLTASDREAVWGFVCDTYGMAERDTAAGLAAFAASEPDQIAQAVFVYSGSAYGKAYVIKGLIANGLPYETYVDASVRPEIEAFQSRMNLIGGYIDGVDGDKLDYAAKSASGGALAVSAAGSVLETGIDDPFFIQFEGASGASYLDYLNLQGEGLTRNLSELMLSRCGREEEAAAGTNADHARLLTEATRERDLVTRWLAADEVEVKNGDLQYTAKYGFCYRSSLEPDNLATGNETETPLPATETTTLAKDSSSPGGLYYYGSQTDKSGYQNEELEQYNTLLRQGQALSQGLANVNTASAARDEYRTAVAPLQALFDADPSNDALDNAVTQALARIQTDDEAMKAAQSATFRLARRIDLLKTETAGAAEALEAVNAQKADYETKIIAPLRAELKDLNAAYEAETIDLNAKKSEFFDANSRYQAKQNALKTMYDDLEAKRINLQTREEILAYAKSLYLKSTGGEESLAVDPETRLAEATFESAKADRAFATLESLFGLNEQRQSILADNPALKQAYDDYGASYRAYLRMKEGQQLIENALQIQYGNVTRAETAAAEAMDALGNAGNLRLLSTEIKPAADEDGAYETWYKATDAAKLYQTAEYWLRYFNLPTGTDFTSAWSAALQYDAAFSATGALSGTALAQLFPDAKTDADLAALKDFQSQADDYVNSTQFMKDFEGWAERLTARGDYDAYMEKVENAYYFLMEEVVSQGFLSNNRQLYVPRAVYRTVSSGGGAGPNGGGGYSEEVFDHWEYDLNPAFTGNLELVRTLAAPFTEATHEEDHWTNLDGTSGVSGDNYPDNKPPIADRVLAGQAEYAALKNDSDFNFLVFLLKSGVMKDDAFARMEAPTGEDWPNLFPLFTHGYMYRDYKRLNPAFLAKAKAKIADLRTEQTKLALLESGNGQNTAAVVLDAIVAAAKLAKPAGFDYGAADGGDAALRGYFSGAVNRYFEAALVDYGKKTNADPKATMSDMAALLSGEAAKDRSGLKTGLDNLLDSLAQKENASLDAYRAAFAAVRNAGSPAELDAAAARLETAGRLALKDCAFQNKDALAAYNSLYQSIIGEYVKDFSAGASALFPQNVPSRGIDASSAVFSEVRDVMDLQRQTMEALYQERLSVYMAVQTSEMSQKLAELRGRETDWSERMNAIIQRGRDEWNRATKKLEAACQDWSTAFGAEYAAKSGDWDSSYLAFNRNKTAWVADAETKLAAKGQVGVAEAVGTSADEAVALSLSGLISDMRGLAVKPDEVVTGLVGTSLFDKISSYARILNQGIASASDSVSVTLAGSDLVNAQVLSKVEDFLSDRREAISEHTAALTARTAGQAIEQAEKDMVKQVAGANLGVDRSVDSLLDNAGYRRNGGTYSRNAIIASALITGNQYEDQSIGSYQYYVAPRFASNVDLSPEAVRDLNQEGINALVDKATRNLHNQLAVIMGGSTGLTTGSDKGTDGSATKGEFQVWVGEQAALKSEGVDPNNDIGENLSKYGSGEMGRIFRAFLGYELRQSKGIAEQRAPFYNKPLWGEFLGIEGPSLRTLVDIGLTIVTKPLLVIPGVGMLANMFVNSLDDLMFMCADIATGTRTAAEAGLEFGIKAAVNVISMGFGALGTAVNTALQLGTDALGVIGKTVVAGVQAVATNAATSAVSALEFNSSGNLSWNADRFREGVIGKGAIAGYLGTMAGTAMTEGLNGTILGEETKKIDSRTGRSYSLFANAEGLNVSNIQSFTGLAGNAFNSLVQYGVSGQTTLNLLRINDVGVLELRLGGEKSSLGIGMGGIDMSAGRIASSIQGLYDIHMNDRITAAAADSVGGGVSARQKAAMMRLDYSYGDDVARQSLNRVLDGQDRLSVDYVPEQYQDAAGRGVTTTVNGSRQMHAYSSGSDDFNTWLAESTTLQHEAYRDGVVGGNNDVETRDAVLAHTQMALRLADAYGAGYLAGDRNLSRDVAAYYFAQNGMLSFNDYVSDNYDSSADYWKLTKKGKLVYDKSGWLRNEEGKYINTDGTISDAPIAGKTIGDHNVENGLLNILYGGTSDKGYETFSIQQKTAVQDLMIASGFIHTSSVKNPNDRDNWYWGGQGLSVTMNGKDVALDASVSVGGNMGRELDRTKMSFEFGGTMSETVFRNMYQKTIDASVRGEGWSLFGSPSQFDRASVERVISLAERMKKIVDNIPRPGKPVYSDEIRDDIYDLMTGMESKDYNFDTSCVDTGRRLAKDMNWKEYAELEKQGDGITGDQAAKVKWLKENPEKGLFLGAYNFTVENGQLILNQFEKSGIPKIDSDYWKAFEMIQDLVKQGHVVLGITPSYEIIQKRYDTGYDHSHFGIFVSATGNPRDWTLRESGGWVTGGGMKPSEWNSTWSIGTDQRGYFRARSIYGTGGDYPSRPFYVYVLYQ